MRGVSTVVDATVFLLLVGGAIATLAAGTSVVPPESDNPAAENARLLATNTATVNYSLAPATESPSDGVSFHRTSGPEFQRTAHSTLVSLIGDAAVGRIGVDGVRFTRTSLDFEQRLDPLVRDQLASPDVETSVVAVWEPYPDSPVSGQFQTGNEPPQDADVNAATLHVDSGIPASSDLASDAAQRDGYRGVARVLADAVVEGVFPPRETQLALRGEYPVDTLTAQRYRQTADALDVRPPGIGETDVNTANGRIANALADEFEADLRARYDSPAAAASAVETDTVHVVVRTWSP